MSNPSTAALRSKTKKWTSAKERNKQKIGLRWSKFEARSAYTNKYPNPEEEHIKKLVENIEKLVENIENTQVGLWKQYIRRSR